MARRNLAAIVLLMSAACGSSGEVAPTTANVGEATPSTISTTLATAAAPSTTTIQPATSLVVDDAGEHDDAHEDGERGETGEGRVVEITMTEFAFQPQAVRVSAGETVRFVVFNAGEIEHELRLSNQHRVEEHLESGHEGHGGEGHHADEGDVLVLVPAGESAELVVEIPEDTTVYTVLACLLPGHYEAGMVGALLSS